MKRHILYIAFLFGGLFTQAQQQDTMYFYRGDVFSGYGENIFLKIAVADVDTMKFNATHDSLRIYQQGAMQNIALADIDSITFEINPCPDCGIGRLEGIPLLGFGVPKDQREKARQHIQAARDSMIAKGYPYDYAFLGWYDVWHEISLLYLDNQRLYESAKLKGFQGDYYEFVNGETLLANACDYLSDTVVIYVGGGPDYGLGTERPMILYHEERKDTTSLSGHYDDFERVPISNIVLDRKYNLPHTSIIQVPHATAGTMKYYTLYDFSIHFFDFYEAGNRGEKPWPENMAPYEDLGLVNDIGVELIRYTVEKLKGMGKTIVYWGGSWGASTMARYLLYYPIEDFAQVNLIGFNPNVGKEIILKDRQYYEDTNDYEPGQVIVGMEIYEILRWRTLPWLTRQNLDRLRIITGGDDARLGFPKSNEIDSLTAKGATIIKVVGAGHNFIEADREEQSWENNIVIYTKDGTEVINDAVVARPVKVPAVKDTTETLPVSDKFKIKMRKLQTNKR